jgi:hypothetical protein
MLIPDVGSAEKWKKYFKGNIAVALGYCERVLGILNNLRIKSEDIVTKKIVAGVIGRDTIGHWRDIQEIFSEFFGIKCVNCDEIIKSIAIGIPAEQVLQKASLKFEDSELVKFVEELFLLLSRILKISNVNIEGHDIRRKIERDLSALVNNPLRIVEIVKGFYDSLRSLLPLYNGFTFFLMVSRSITNTLLEKYFKSLDLEMLNRFGIRFKEENICSNIKVFMHERESVGYYTTILVPTIYSMFSKSRSLRRFIGDVNEEEKFIKEMLKIVSNIYRDLGYVEEQPFYVALYRGAIATRVRANHIHLVAKVRIDNERDTATIHTYSTSCENFVHLLEPYIITGLAYIESISKAGNKLELTVNMFLHPSSIKAL